MVDLIEMYLHSREIQLKIEAATKPKIKPVNELVNCMLYTGTTAPANPKQGDMYLDLTSHHSIVRVYDGEKFVVVGSAYDSATIGRPGPGYPYDRSYHDLAAPLMPMRELTEEQMREFRVGLEHGMVVTGGLTPGVITSVDLPTQQIPMNARMTAEAIQDLREANRNGNRYIGIDYDSMASHNHNISVEHVPADGIMRTGYALPADGVMRANHLEGVGARRERSASGTLNGIVNMDVLRSLLGGM